MNPQKISEILKDESAELDENFPPLVNIKDIYHGVSVEYEILIKELSEKEKINNDLMNKILKKIHLMIETDKNKLIIFIGYNSENYKYHINHGINSTIIALIGGMELKFSEEELSELGIAGLFHDLGMRKIPESIISKNEKLSEEEYDQIKTHPVIAYKYLEDKDVFSKNILDAILQHHEQNNGKGYPQKLKSDKISKFAKILSIADAIESQIAFRSYREKRSSYNAIKEILKNTNNSFDNTYLEAFINAFSIYPPGTLVQMNNNSIGTVFSVVPYFPLKPQVKIIIDEFGDKITKDLIKDLSNEKDLFIVRVLNDEEYMNRR